jgi:polysaccharide pyruvyl transferase WcaK-like protein
MRDASTSRLSKVTVGFAWQTLSSHNLGVGALAEANLALALKAASSVGLNVAPVVFCHSEIDKSLGLSRGIEFADPMSIKKMITGRSNFLSKLAECNVLLDIGEGDSFADIYGNKRLFLLLLSKYLSSKVKTPFILSPQTIGPFDSWWARFLSRNVMRRAHKVFARDGLSMQYLRGEKILSNAVESIDVAFGLPYERQTNLDAEKIHVGINVSGLLFNGGYNQRNQFSLVVDYPVFVRQMLDWFSEQENVQLHLVGHVISDSFEVEDDYRVIQRLQADYPSAIVAPRFKTPSEAKGYIAGLDFFTGARMHACIGAFSSGVPVVPLAYSRKFNGLFNSLGYTDLVDMKAHSTQEAFALVKKGFLERKELADKVAAGNVIAKGKLEIYENYLKSTFLALAR